MKPTPRSKVAMPKARVMWCDAKGRVWAYPDRDLEPVAIIPHRTKSEAQAACRFANLSWEEKVEVVARALMKRECAGKAEGYWGQHAHGLKKDATAILSALGERPERGGGK